LVVAFRTDSPGFLFVDENFFPGWKALLDRKATRVWKADYTFRAIYAEPGGHIVDFVYQPWAFRMGVWTSLATLACIIVAFVCSRFFLAAESRGEKG
jgi:uncharacterized membrane protein YfhO